MREEKSISINESYAPKKTGELVSIILTGMKSDAIDFIREMVNEVKESIDIDDIIQAVLDHVECKHTPSHEEDGVHVTDEYDVDDGCHEAVRKVLGVEK